MNHFKLLGLWALIAALLVACGGDVTPTPDRSRITVEEIVNRVETGWAGNAVTEPDFLPAEIGQELVAGSGVKTFQDSEARVDIRVQDLLRIIRTTPNTVWRLGEFAVERETIIELEQGKVFLLDDLAPDEGNPFKVVTPAGTASPRGTIWSVEFDQVTGIARFECFRGICEVANSLGTQVLTDGQWSDATADTAPSPPRTIKPEDLITFAGLPELVSGEIPLPTPRVAIPTQAPAPTEAPTPTSRLRPTRVATRTPVPQAAPTRAAAPTPTPIPTQASGTVSTLPPPATPTPIPTQASGTVPTLAPPPTPTATPVATLPPTATPKPTPTPVPTSAPPMFKFTSSAIRVAGHIPSEYTCDGRDISPPLVWSEPPAGTKSFAIIFDDPDAPRGTWTHWVAYNIAPDLRGLGEDQLKLGSPTSAALQGLNSWGAIDYGGPCPPAGTVHNYRMFLYALDLSLPLVEGATKEELLEAMKSHILAERLITGTYSRQ